MKRAQFTPGFAELRGNISGKQKLEYAENNNPAFDAPNGVQYARNYRPSVIISQVAKTGKFHFAIKTKSATRINTVTKLKMALLGGAGAVRAAIKKNAVIWVGIQALYANEKAGGYTSSSLDKWLFENIYAALQVKAIMIQFISHTGGTSFNIQNPWVYENQQGGSPVSVPAAIIAKFWGQLAKNPIFFYVDGMKGVAHLNDTFNTVISRPYNNLGLTKDETTPGYVKLGEMFVTESTPEDEGQWYSVSADEEVTPAYEYVLSDTNETRG